MNSRYQGNSRVNNAKSDQTCQPYRIASQFPIRSYGQQHSPCSGYSTATNQAFGPTSISSRGSFQTAAHLYGRSTTGSSVLDIQSICLRDLFWDISGERREYICMTRVHLAERVPKVLQNSQARGIICGAGRRTLAEASRKLAQNGIPTTWYARHVVH